MANLPSLSKYYYIAGNCFPSVFNKRPKDADYQKEKEKLEQYFGSDDTIERFESYLDKCFDKKNAIKPGINQIKETIQEIKEVPTV